MERQEQSENKLADLSAMLSEAIESPEFHTQDTVGQVQALIDKSAEAFGLSPDSIPDQKSDKQWGGYLTIRFDQHGAEKLLFVRPVPLGIPSTWDWSGEYATAIERRTGEKGVALSLQRHTDDRTEDWHVLHGRGCYLTSEDPESPLDHLEVTQIGGNRELHVGHDGHTWHTVVNPDPNDFLIIHEIIESAGDFREEAIERHSDLFSRAGRSDNV